LLTYCYENGSRDADDGKAARSVLKDGGGSLWCSSGSDGDSSSGGVVGWPSSKKKLDSGGLDSVG
jgi:hypothetical protein